MGGWGVQAGHTVFSTTELSGAWGRSRLLISVFFSDSVFNNAIHVTVHMSPSRGGGGLRAPQAYFLHLHAIEGPRGPAICF